MLTCCLLTVHIVRICWVCPRRYDLGGWQCIVEDDYERELCSPFTYC